MSADDAATLVARPLELQLGGNRREIINPLALNPCASLCAQASADRFRRHREMRKRNPAILDEPRFCENLIVA